MTAQVPGTQGEPVEIDGFPLLVEQVGGRLRLVGDHERRLYDGERGSLLNTPISVVTDTLDEGRGNWAKILAGEGFSYGVAGCVPAERYGIDTEEAVARFTSATGRRPDGPMWYVFFDQLSEVAVTFIPYGTLKAILAFARDLAQGGDVAAEAISRVRGAGA